MELSKKRPFCFRLNCTSAFPQSPSKEASASVNWSDFDRISNIRRIEPAEDDPDGRG